MASDRTCSWKSRARASSRWWALAALAAATGGGGAGCGRAGGGAAAATDVVQLELDFGGGVTLASVDYVITRTTGFRRTGTLAVGDDATITATFPGLPPGPGYTIEVRGTATDGETMCRGDRTFEATPGMTTLQIPLTCSGRATVTAAFNVCPTVDGLEAIPSEVQVGGAIGVIARVHDPDDALESLSAIWAASGGALSGLSVAGATFTCTEAGTFTVGLRVADGGGPSRCPDTSTIRLTCTPQAGVAP